MEEEKFQLEGTNVQIYEIHESANENENFGNLKVFGECTTKVRDKVDLNWVYMTH